MKHLRGAFLAIFIFSFSSIALTPIRDECRSNLIDSTAHGYNCFISISPQGNWVLEEVIFGSGGVLGDSISLYIFQYCYPPEKRLLSTFYKRASYSGNWFVDIGASMWQYVPTFMQQTWSPNEDTIYLCLRNTSINTINDTSIEVFKIDISSITVGNITTNHQALSPKLLKSTTFPNPFSKNVTIEYSIPNEGYVAINIYNAKGELINVLGQEKQIQGTHSIIWNGKDNLGNQLANGTYYYQIISGNSISVKSIIKLK